MNRESIHKTRNCRAADTLGKVVLLRRLKLYAQNPHILFMYICSCSLCMHMNCKKPYKKADETVAAYMCMICKDIERDVQITLTVMYIATYVCMNCKNNYILPYKGCSLYLDILESKHA